MKKIIVSFLILFVSICSYSQVSLSQEQLDSLPPAAKAAIQASVAKENAKQQMQNISAYAGLGKEIGEAVNGALSAVENHVISVSKTDLGQTAIFIVCWKLLYSDIIHVTIGLILLIILCVWMWSSLRFMRTETFMNWDESTGSSYIASCFIGWLILFVTSILCFFVG